MSEDANEMRAVAGRGRRLAAAAIDFVLVLVAGLVLVVATGAFEDADDYTGNVLPRIIGLGFLAYFLINGWHLARNSQTLGKAILGLVVVEAGTTNPAPWWRLAIRSPFFLALYSISLGPLVLLPVVDQAFIFRSNRRCLHDLFCGTEVLRV